MSTIRQKPNVFFEDPVLKKKDPQNIYAAFLELSKRVHEDGKFPALDPIEERILLHWASVWYADERPTVLEAMRMISYCSATTAHRRLKKLIDKGYVTLERHAYDERIRYVAPTKLATDLFSALGRCMEQAGKR